MSIKTIENMVEWVELNLEDNPSLDAMSSHVGYSSFYCSSKFHETVGLPFKSYVQKRKLSSATKDLMDSKDRIIDIAFKYGFSSHEAFTRAFSREHGVSPSKYRNKLPHLHLFEKYVI